MRFLRIEDDDGLQIRDSLEINEHFPHLLFYIRPYKEILSGDGLESEEGWPVCGWTVDLFMDGYSFFSTRNNQTQDPWGGYFSIPNMIGNRDLISQWAVVPKNLDQQVERDCFGRK